MSASPDSPSPRPSRAWWPVSVFVGAIALFFGGGLWTGAESLFTHDIGFSDHWHFHVPLKKIYQEALSTGQLPWWSHELSTGFPLLAEGQLGALYPPNVILFSLFGLSQALGLALILHLVLAGSGAYRLARELPIGTGAACLVGLVFMLSGFMVTHAKHLNMIEAAAWLPWLILEARRVATGRSKGPLLGMYTALSLLAGHPQMTFYALLVSGVMGAAALPWKIDGRQVSRGLSRGLLAVMAGALLSSPQWLHTLELAGESARGAGMTWEEANQWAYTPEMLRLLFQPDAFGDPALLEESALGGLRGFSPPEGVEAFYWEVTGYVGWLPWALLLFLLFRKERKSALPWVGLGGVSLLLALGDNGGLGEWLFHGLPGYDLFRFHSRWLLVFGLAMAILAGLGFDALLRWLPHHQRRYAPWLIGCVLVLAWSDSFLALGHHNPRIQASEWLTPPPSVTHIQENTKGEGRPFRVMVQDPGDRSFQSGYVAAKGWMGDLSPYHGARAAFRPNLGALYGLNNLFYYFHLAPDRLKQGIQTALLPGGAVSQTHAGRLNVKYLVAAGPRGGHRGQTCLGGGPATCVQVLPNPQFQPRYQLASFAHVVPPGDPLHEQALRVLMGKEFNPGQDVVIEGPGNLNLANGEGPLEGSVQLKEYGNHRVELSIRTNRPAWLVTSDTYYPGWSARLNGEEATIYPANISGRAVLIPAGFHQLELLYRPTHFTLGWILFALGGALCVGLLRVGRSDLEE